MRVPGSLGRERRHQSRRLTAPIRGLENRVAEQLARRRQPGASVLVPVVLMNGMAVTVVDVVDVVVVRNRLMSTVGAVLMISVIGVSLMREFALVPVPLVLMMYVTIVEVVDVVAVRHRGVATARPVEVRMLAVGFTRHARPPFVRWEARPGYRPGVQR